MDEAVQRRVRAHDQYQVEFKLDYQLSPRKRTRYQITTYIYVPQSLAIRHDTYPQSEFYRDIQNYVRLQTPRCPLRELRQGPDSPLGQISALLTHKGDSGRVANGDRLIESLKFFRAILKRSLRAEVRQIRRSLASTSHPPEQACQTQPLIIETVDEAKAILATLRALEPQLAQAYREARILRAFRLADEAISLVMEEFLLNLFRTVQQRGEESWRREIACLIEAEVEAEIDYRLRAGYRSILRADGDNEGYLYRLSVLKKYMSSVLYLALTVQREGTAVEHMLFALAAGLSMIFATVVAFFFQMRYGIFTFPVFVALVVGYMFKDRIKEMARTFFAHYLRQYIFDRRILIHTLDGKERLGVMREKVTYLDEHEAPPHVAAIRNRDLLAEVEHRGQEENIICYMKEVALETAPFQRMSTGGRAIDGITDIMRHDIRPYLRKMDDPVEMRPYLQDGVLTMTPCAKAYYLNIISVYTSEGKRGLQLIKRTKVALTRDGIKRVERF